MRVTQIFKTYKTETVGGIEEVMSQLAHGMSVHGIEAQILTLSKNPYPTQMQDGPVQVLLYGIDLDLASTPFSLRLLLNFGRAIRTTTILHYQFPWPFADLLHILWRPRQPVIVAYQSDIVKQKSLMWLYRPLMHAFLRRADAIVATSPNYIETSPVLQRYREKTTVIPIGIDDHRTVDSAVVERLQARIGHLKFFAFVGVLRYYKGLHYLIEASQSVDFPIVIAGGGPKERELKAQAESLGLKNLVFLGPVSPEEKRALLSLCYAFVFPSHLRSEAFGISLLEAAMFGKPMISTEIGSGMSYINRDEETGLTVPGADAAGLRKAMQRLWDHPADAARMGAAARKRYETLFTAKTMVASYVALYQRLAGR